MISKIKLGWHQCLIFVLTLMMTIGVMSMTSYAAGPYPFCDGNVSVNVSGSSSDKAITGGVSVSVKGSSGLFGIGASDKTATINIYNESSDVATISFDYKMEKGGTLTIDSKECGETGNYPGVLNPGEFIVVKVTSQKSSTTTTLTLSNITYKVAASSSKVTFEYDNSLGNITVGGETVANGSVKEIAVAGTNLTATPVSGATFLGWVDTSTGLICATDGTFKPAGDCTLKAVFVNANSNAWFKVDNIYLFDDLNKACAAGNMIIPVNNGKLSAGDYTIPAGKTLLIPFDDANTLYTDEPEPATHIENYIFETPDKYQTPTVYRKLIMENGANITVNGVISLSAKHYVANGGDINAGSPMGPCSFIEMKQGSNITVNNGGNLYVWGFIYGNGTVTAKSGATLYENMQINDFRGGSATSAIAQSTVFPFSQYYLQNIEVPVTIHAGASEKAYTSLYMSSMVFSAGVPFIANKDAMFVPQNGYIVKDYNEQLDRLDVDIYGDISISSMSMEMGTSNINTSTMNLPITNNITVNVHSGTITANQNMLLLPGAEIIIGEDANMIIGEGINAYAMDKKTWTSANYVIKANNDNIKPLGYKAGSTVTRTVNSLKDASIVVNGSLVANGYIYTTANGADICSTGNGEIIMTAFDPNATPVLEQYQDNATRVNIPVTMAKLHNEDGSYLTTCAPVYDADGNPIREESIFPTTGMYFYENGAWDEYKPGFYYNANGGTGEMVNDIPDIFTMGEPITIQKCGFEREGYAFAGWSTEPDGKANTAYAPGTVVDYVEEEITLYAVWEEEEVVYTIKWIVDGEETLSEAEPGVVPSFGENVPTKDADAQYTYTFAGWATTEDGAVLETIPEATDNATYYAVFNKTLNKYTVTWVVNGVNNEVEYDYGTIPEFEGSTDKAQDGCTVYTFDGWDKEVVAVTGEGAVYTAQYSESKSHTLKHHESVPATCTEDGNVEYWYCSVCEKNFDADGKELETVVDAKKGHTKTHYAAVEKTCTKDGNIEYWYCSACEKNLDANENEITTSVVIPASHTLTSVGRVEATCTAEGNVAYDKCTVCLKNFDADGKELSSVIIPVVEHDWDDGVVDPEPTCTTEGTKTFTCRDCKATKTKSVEKLAHELTHVEKLDPTCEEPGNVEYWSCSTCEKNYDKDANVDKDAQIIGNVVLNALGHEFATEDGEEPCANCGVAQKMHPGKDHTYGEFVVTLDPTCTKDGLKVKTCTCGDTITEPIPATDHDLTKVEAVDATCTTDGNVYHWHCENCGVNFETEEAKEDEVINNVIIDALGHALTHHEAVPATCEEPGNVEYWSCSGCTTIFGAEDESIVLDTFVIDATGHNTAKVDAKPATCEEPGNVEYWMCLTCEAMFDAEEDGKELKEEDVVIGANGHTLNHVEAVEATCTTDGNVEYWNCEVCHKNFDAAENGEEIANVVVVNKDNHTLTHVEAVEATCLKDGNVEYWNCGLCGKNFDADGKEIANVVVDGKDNHDLQHVEGKKATCKKPGWEAYDKCMREGCGYTTFVEIPKKTEHDYIVVENVTSCIDCGKLADEQPDAEIKAGLIKDEDGKYRYYVDGKPVYAGLVRDTEGHYYYINSTKTAVANSIYTIGEAKANGLLPAGKYEFDAEGRMVGYIHNIEQDVKNGLMKDEDGKLRYYVDGVAVYAGLVQDAEGNFYYINSSKAAVTNCSYTIGEARTNGLVPAGTYQFGADGKMIVKSVEKNGLIKDEDGKIRYYVNGVATYAGIVQDAEGNFYYINSSKTAVTNCTYTVGASRTNGLVSAGTYEFGADGKMIIKSEAKSGLVKDADGKIRYYEDGKAVYAGLVQDADGNYYYINSSLAAVTDTWYGIYASKMNDISDIEEGIYYFDNGGRLSMNKAWDGTLAKEHDIFKLINDEGVIEVKTAIEFASVFNYLTKENVVSGENTKVINKVVLVNDIDLGNVEWVLNADSTVVNDDVVIVGNNHSISNLNGTLLPEGCTVDYSSLVIK